MSSLANNYNDEHMLYLSRIFEKNGTKIIRIQGCGLENNEQRFSGIK